MLKVTPLLAVLVSAALGGAILSATPAPAQNAAANVSPQLSRIVVQYDAATGNGFDWEELQKLSPKKIGRHPGGPLLSAVPYLREAVQRMTGNELPVVSTNDLSHGIALTLLKNAPAEIQTDPKVIAALAGSGEDTYNANEAFYVRSEPSRVLIVANTAEGLLLGVNEMLESVGYEVLGVGPNWTHVPDYRNKPLIFNLERSDRPGFYTRRLWVTCGQARGVGTLTKTVPHPDDEPVEASYERWRVGTRMRGQSMPYFPGHALQGYRAAVVEKMLATKNPAGFLTDGTHFGADAKRPAPSEANKAHLWFNTDAEGSPEAGKVFSSDGAKWTEHKPLAVKAGLDLSVPLVREIILEDLKKRAEAHFDESPDELLIFGTDPEDGGGYLNLGKRLHNRNWYPEYLRQAGVPFGEPYVLHGFKELNQPRELWDPDAVTDTVFGFNNWLLREFDKYIDSLPAERGITASGQSKKELVRTSLYSYNLHDVPPNFNLDPRIRVQIAGFPNHRGRGKWKKFASQLDMAEAYRILLPREPSGNYWILSNAYRDVSSLNIRGSHLPETIHRRIQEESDAGIRALSAEVDLNFGKRGLEYYLYTKMLWNPKLTVAELDAIRDRWLQRSFGNGWREMKEYYDYMAPENYTLNAPNTWARAIRMIEAADKKIDVVKEPMAKRRLDDLKQFWYFYYLLEIREDEPNSQALKELVWKGQMSYINAMHAVTSNLFNSQDARAIVGVPLNEGPAHFTAAETQQWWAKVLDRWQLTPVDSFADAVLADGSKGRALDVNDLVEVEEFAHRTVDATFVYNSSSGKDASFYTVAREAGEEIGFQFFWRSGEHRHQVGREVSYGISRWNPQRKEWEELVDKTMTAVQSQLETNAEGLEYQMVRARYQVPQPGTYLVELGRGGNGAQLTTLNYDLKTGDYSRARGHTYFDTLVGHTQGPVFIYIPKGTKSFDLEIWDMNGGKQLHLHNGLPAEGMTKTRIVDVSARGTHRVQLEPGEDGSIAQLQTNGFNFPHLYSLPMLYAKSPSALLVPRALAKMDGLTIKP